MSAAVEMEVSGRQVLGRYRIVRRLAQGGMGVVYLGRVEGAAGFSKAVVIKRIIPDADDLQESTARFIREAQILSNLQHPGIVGVLDFGEENEGYSMVLEYVHGYDLGRWLKYVQVTKRRIDWEQAVYIMLKVLDALAYAHNFVRPDGTPAEVLHRDISPGNILLDLEGRARLLDFGIARMAEGEAGQYKTQEGVLKGKVAFLAPELFSSSPPSRSSDIYACAVVLYQMLAGRNPFLAENESKVMWRVIMEAPPPLSAIRDDLPLELESALMMALHKDPEDRHGSAEDFARDLRRSLMRDDQEIASSLRDQLRADFNGDMPSLLRLEPLSERDQAWRNSQDRSVLDLTPLRTSAAPLPPTGGVPPPPSFGRSPPLPAAQPQQSPRGISHNPTVTAVSPGAAVPRKRHDPPPSEGRPAEIEPESVASAVRNAPLAQPQWRHILTLGLSIGLVIALGLGGAMVYFQQQANSPAAGRFIVVESPRSGKAGKAASAPPAAAVSAPTTSEQALPAQAEGATPPPQGKRPPAKRVPARADAASLSRTFARRNASLHSCFERFAQQLEGQPQITVQFDVKASGKVSSAGLIPSSLNGTPLGQCLLRVARDTSFGSIGRPARFSIPIRARTVGG